MPELDRIAHQSMAVLGRTGRDDTLVLLYHKGSAAWYLWRTTDDELCVAALTTDGGNVTQCLPHEDPDSGTGARLRTIAHLTPIGNDWGLLVAADHETIRSADCGGRELAVASVGTAMLQTGLRRYYLIQTPWELAGKPVADVQPDGGSTTSEVLDVPAEPIGHGLPGQVCEPVS